jgi:predicted SpoU family rRNA methylase
MPSHFDGRITATVVLWAREFSADQILNNMLDVLAYATCSISVGASGSGAFGTTLSDCFNVLATLVREIL